MQWCKKDVDYQPDAPTMNIIRMSAFSFVLLVTSRFSSIDSFINKALFTEEPGTKS